MTDRRLPPSALCHALLYPLEGGPQPIVRYLPQINRRLRRTRFARHHVARQTAHDRLRVGKQLLGAALDEPAAHAAIVVALHASLPAWREEVAARAARS